jgi:hypothetical protein
LKEFEMAASLAKLSNNKAKSNPFHRRELIAELQYWYMCQGGDDHIWSDDKEFLVRTVVLLFKFDVI